MKKKSTGLKDVNFKEIHEGDTVKHLIYPFKNIPMIVFQRKDDFEWYANEDGKAEHPSLSFRIYLANKWKIVSKL